MTPLAERIEENRDNIRVLRGDDFADGLEKGITVAWQNIPYIKSAWPDWARVAKLEEEQADVEKNITYDQLLKGDKNFYTYGDRNSQFPGWKEGAIQSALNVVYPIVEFVPYLFDFPEVSHVPNTNAIVQGSYYEE